MVRSNSDSTPYDVREAHYRRFFGEDHTVWHPSGKEERIHVDVLSFPPQKGRSWFTFATNGMSDLDQPLEKFDLANAEEWKRVEAIFYARADGMPGAWAAKLLNSIGKYPWDEGAFIGWHHTYSWDTPLDGKHDRFKTVFFLPPYFEGQGFDRKAVDGRLVHIMWAVPITAEELAFAKSKGGQALEDRLSDANIDPVFDPTRASVV
ncbi:MAG: suppressor of fused domain protein [Planctomycetes bacterium]|nr:suppressor of fused domain protein [Planctomycetota bacterium]